MPINKHRWTKAGGGGSGASGDVTGPASSTDNAIARYDGAGGKTLQDSAVTVSDVASNVVTIASAASNGVAIDVVALRLDATSEANYLLFGNNNLATGYGIYYNALNDGNRLRLIFNGSEQYALADNGLSLGSSKSVLAGPDLIGNNADTRLERAAAHVWEVVGGRATDTGVGFRRIADANGSYEQFGAAAAGGTEALTLNTGATTTATSASLVPANCDIPCIVVRITTTITTAANFTVAPTGKNPFTIKGTNTTSLTTLTAGTTYVLGPDPDTYGADVQNDTAKTITVTCNANPGAGAMRITVFPRVWSPPTS